MFRVALRTIVTSVCLMLLLVTASTISVLAGFAGSGEQEAQCAIVFGAAVHRGTQPGPAITRRVSTAVRLYRAGRVHHLFLTGGKGDDLQSSEAAVMQDFALAAGIPPESITREDDARSTLENLRNTLPLAKNCASVLAISDRYHLARIRLLARREGWGRVATFPASPTATLPFEVASSIREVLGYMYYALYADTFIVLSGHES